MISIVYGSLVAGLPNNRAAYVGCHGRYLPRDVPYGDINLQECMYSLPTISDGDFGKYFHLPLKS
jgi:hypothetical protein